MTIYIILGPLGDGSEYIADENILTPILSTTKANIIFRNDQEWQDTDIFFLENGWQVSTCWLDVQWRGPTGWNPGLGRMGAGWVLPTVFDFHDLASSICGSSG
jgi:hypothetical protein